MSFDKKKTKVGVLLGGLSEEREVSLRSGRAMAKGLRDRGWTNVIEIDVGYDVMDVIRREKIDVAMIALHGRFGEDGRIQGMLEYLRVPYTGTGVLGSAIAMDKVTSKRLFQACGVPTPHYFVADGRGDGKLLARVEKEIGYPAVAKPPMGGSTIGLTIVRSPDDVEKAQQEALRYGTAVLWEKFLSGKELTVGFLTGQALPIVEIVPKKGLYDYEAKYTKGMTDYYCPARVSPEVTKKVQEVAIRACEALRVEGFGRVDVLWADEAPWVLEANTIPGMTETSLLPKAAAAAGIPFDEMVEKIVQDASSRVEVLKR